jgi:sulfite exporter TauE/SafE
MCGAACAGIGQSGVKSARSMWIFQAGRLIGYSALGGLAALSMQSLGWLTVHAAPLRPLWSLVHVVAAMLGLMLLWQARQPIWLENAARKVWSLVRNATGNVQGGAPLLIGMMWSLLPCGLLYSALLVAALAGSVIDGIAVMALFALGSGVSLMLGPWLLLRLGRQGSGRWSIRIAGLILFGASVWGLWMSLMHNTAPWCVTS